MTQRSVMRRSTYLFVGSALGIVLLLMLMLHSRRSSFAASTVLELTEQGIIAIPSNLELSDFAATQNGVSLLLTDSLGYWELAEINPAGVIQTRKPLPTSGHTRGRIAVSSTGETAMLRTAHDGVAEVLVYSGSGAPLDIISPSGPVLEIGYLGSALVGVSWERIVSLKQTDVDLPLVPQLSYPFALLPLPTDTLGIVELSEAKLRTVRSLETTPPLPMSQTDLDRVPNDARKSGAAKMFAVTADQSGNIFCALPNFTANRNLIIEITIDGTVRQKFHYQTVMDPNGHHLHFGSLRVSGTSLYVHFRHHDKIIRYGVTA